MANSAQPDAVPWPIVLYQILRYGPQLITKPCAMAHRTEIVTDFYCMTSYRIVPIAHNKIRHNGP
jgi:hypothetical protein